jgi:hypothetical protein
MVRLEQVRSELLERFERVDRRLTQHEQRLARIDQRTIELGERLMELLEKFPAAAPRNDGCGPEAA